jgi:hypothetical protein
MFMGGSIVFNILPICNFSIKQLINQIPCVVICYVYILQSITF